MAPRDQRGAVLPILAMMIVLVIAFAAFAVDLGTQRAARRDMQAVSDVVALDVARLVDGRTRQQITTGVGSTPAKRSLASAIAESVARNAAHTVGSGPAVQVYLVKADSLGRYPGAGGVPTQVAVGEVPNAVVATASTSVKFSFGQVVGVGSAGASRSALAQATSGACFSLGSYVARLRTSDSPILGPLLGAINSNLNLSAADYSGLAGVRVDLVELLKVDLGAGTFDELMRGNQLIGLGKYYLALATALQKGSGNTAQIALLQTLATKVGGLNVPLGKVLNLGTGTSQAGLEAGLNLLDLVAAGAFAANGTNAIAIPNLKVDLGPLLKVQATAHIIQKPQIGCGRKGEATASTSQVRIDLATTVADVDLGLLSSKVELSGYVELASASGTLTDIRCDPPGITVRVADGLTVIHLLVKVQVFALFGLVPLAEAPILIDGTSPSSGDAVVTITQGDYSKPVHVGDASSGLPWLNIDTSKLKVLSLPVGSVTDALVSPILSLVVNPLVQGLDTLVLAPLLKSLGLSVTGADVFAIPTPACGVPRLIG